MIVLGLWDGHDAGAALVVDGEVVAAVNEERLTRRKLEIGFPRQSILSCLEIAGIEPEQVEVAACTTSDPGKTLARLAPSTAEAYYRVRRRLAPPGRLSGIKKALKYRVTCWPTNGLTRGLSRRLIAKRLRSVGLGATEFELWDHHLGHAAGAALASGFDSCLVLTIDGVGDGLGASVSRWEDGQLRRVGATKARDSLGILFEHVTNLLNMRELEDEGKVMAIAGNTLPIPDAENPILDLIRVEGLSFKASRPVHAMRRDLSEILWRMSNEQFAFIAQRALEVRATELVCNAVEATGLRRIALAGGVASNIKMNREIRLLPQVEAVSVFPHMGDGGLALGAACASLIERRIPLVVPNTLALGPSFPEPVARGALDALDSPVRRSETVADEVASLLAEERVVLWFQGRMEWGPRALGQRSILARADRLGIRDRVNLLLKRRAWYQPFCPTMLESEAAVLLEDLDESPNRHMTMAYAVRSEHRAVVEGVISNDGTCRPQILADDDPSPLAEVLRALRRRGERGVLLNTSLNVHGEPLVCAPEQAVEIYRSGSADALAMGDLIVGAVPSDDRSLPETREVGA